MINKSHLFLRNEQGTSLYFDRTRGRDDSEENKMRLRRTIDIKKINCMNLMLNLKEAGAFVMSVEVVE